MERTPKNVEKELQLMLHDMGLRDFVISLKIALDRAAKDTKDFDNKKISEQYESLATMLYLYNEFKLGKE